MTIRFPIKELPRRIFIAVVSSLSFFAILISAKESFAQVPPWQLPLILSDSNTSVSFSVESTWHTVHGVCTSVDGIVANTDARNTKTISVDVKIPVNKFDTESESRDENLRKVMAAEQFPFVHFKSTSFVSDCAQSKFQEICHGTLGGEIGIREVAKPIELQVKITPDSKTFNIEANTSLNWDEFGVEDPSILIAKLDKKVDIKIKLVLPRVLNLP